MPKKHSLGITVFGLALIIYSCAWFVMYNYEFYSSSLGYLAKSTIQLRYLISVLGRIAGIACGIGLLFRNNIFRKLTILLCSITILIIYWKHPIGVFQQIVDDFILRSNFLELTWLIENIIPGLAWIPFGFYCAFDIGFSLAFIYYFTRDDIKLLFMPTPTKIKKEVKIPKHKHPLLAILFSILFLGTGHLYVKRYFRAVLILYINILTCTSLFTYLHQPEALFNYPFAVSITAYIILSIFVILDAFKCAHTFNKRHASHRNIPLLEMSLMTFAIGLAVFMMYGSLFFLIWTKSLTVFNITANTMTPTLQVGENILVDRASYLFSKPKRGDIVALKYPIDKNKSVVSRLIATEGEEIQIINGDVYINSQLVLDPLIKNIHYINRNSENQISQKIKVSNNSYFVLADNTYVKHDSRYWGLVPKKDLIGKVITSYRE